MIHVYPVGDVAPHAVDGDWSDCWCDPDVEWVDPETGVPYGEPIAVHHSSDGRELEEGVVMSDRFVRCDRKAREIAAGFRILRHWYVGDGGPGLVNRCAVDVPIGKLSIGLWDTSVGPKPDDYELHEVLHAALRALCSMDRRKPKALLAAEEDLVQDICACLGVAR